MIFGLVEYVVEWLEWPPVFLILMAWVGYLAFMTFQYKKNLRIFHTRIPTGKYAADKFDNEKSYSDVIVVGSGPSGATCAYYLAKGGAKVTVLDKKQFPRDKYCGDAVCKTAIEILMDMGVYQELIDENKGKVADSGGFVSPGGLSYIGASHKVLGEIPAALAVKRLHLDEKIARKAQSVGADLRELHEVVSATFDGVKGLWTVECRVHSAEEEDIVDNDVERKEPKETSGHLPTVTIVGRVLVCADGATSGLATKLGLVTTQPQGVCSRQFIKGGSHQLKTDGVVYYNKSLLPGYAAVFKHPNDELNFCTYLIPGNPKVTNDTLRHWHEFLREKDPNVALSLGPNHENLEPMRAGALRLGGEKNTYGAHLIVTGDAAGFIDPLTGEGIHHAMEGGMIAGKFLLECREAGNYDAAVMKLYHERWMYQFGYDFWWSMVICQFLYRFPVLIDAATAAVQRKGNDFLAVWAEIMTGRQPKITLLHPKFAIVVTYELVRMLISKKSETKKTK